ncbi:MAG TPA: TetR/AcrR family transcriptional regulator [Acidimicrobiia bacterium]
MNGPQPVEVETPVEPARLDGRTARSAKTRNSIADALLDLLTDGELRPTARQIADRAAVSVRSVYVHFDDLEDLFCVAARRHLSRVAPMLVPTPSRGTLGDRAEALVRQRIRLHAHAGSIARATRLHAEFSPTLARILRDYQTRSRADLERVFAEELGALSAAQRTNTLAVLDVLTGPDAWDALRARHGLTGETAMHCVKDSIVLHLRAVSA